MTTNSDNASAAAGDGENLRRFVESRDEAALRALVEKYGGLVYGVALRKTGDAQLAEEVAQNVFLALSRKGGRLLAHRSLGAWLHRAATLEGLKAARGAATRRRHLAMIREHEEWDRGGDDAAWHEIRTHLDESLARLPEPDRAVLVLHYFEGLSFADVGERTGRSAAAAQKRGARALEKLARGLRRRGIGTSAAALAGGLGPELAQAAPAGLVAKVGATVMAPATAGSAAGAVVLSVMSTSKTVFAVTFVLAAAVPVGVELAARPEGGAATGPAPLVGEEAGIPSAVDRPTEVPVDGPSGSAFDPSAFRRSLEALVRSGERDGPEARALQRLLFTLGLAEVREAVAVLEGFGEAEPFYDIVGAAFARWAELDPEAAVANAVSRPPSRWGYYPLNASWLTWAFADWEGARSWLAGAETEYDHQFLFWAYLDRQAGLDGRLAVERAGELGDDHPDWSEQILRRALSGWAAGDPNETINWMDENLQDPLVRDSLAGEVLEGLGEREPATALDHTTLIGNPERLREVRYNIFWGWALHQPAAAADYFRDTSAGDHWDGHTVRSAGEAIARNDPERALALAETIADESRRDAFYVGILGGAQFSDPLAVARAAEAVSAEGARTNDSLGGFLRHWVELDPAAAREWVEALPDGEKKEWARHGLPK